EGPAHRSTGVGRRGDSDASRRVVGTRAPGGAPAPHRRHRSRSARHTVIHAALRAAVRTERLSRFSGAFLAHRAAKFGLAEPNAARPPLRNRRSEVRILSGAAT